MSKNVLITGAGKRIGAACARKLHQEGWRILIHYHTSERDANSLCAELNRLRSGSAELWQADLADAATFDTVNAVAAQFGGIDVLVNNASAFYATPFGSVSSDQWEAILASNLKAPFFLTQLLQPMLKERQGVIVNIADIHAERGLPGYAVYSIAKAGLVTMTRVLAKELGPEIRVNGVAPGAIIWPEQGLDEAGKAEILRRVALMRAGCADDIAKAVLFLIRDADYMTGQILTVDGGRTLFY